MTESTGKSGRHPVRRPGLVTCLPRRRPCCVFAASPSVPGSTLCANACAHPRPPEVEPPVTASLLTRLFRPLLATAGALVLAGSIAACGASAPEKAAQEVGYREGDGSLLVIKESDRQEPIELSGQTIQGKAWDSADHRGSVVVVNLWASWCGPCAKEAPHLVEAHEETASDDVEFVGINSRESSKSTGLAQSKAWGFEWPSVYDKSGSTAIDMQGKTTAPPSTAVLDREGRIAVVVLGPVTKDTLVGIIEDTKAEQDGS